MWVERVGEKNGGIEGQIKRSGHRAVWSVFAPSLSVSGAIIMEVWEVC